MFIFSVYGELLDNSEKRRKEFHKSTEKRQKIVDEKFPGQLWKRISVDPQGKVLAVECWETKEKAMTWVKSSEHRSFDETGPFVNRSNIEFKLWDHCDSVPVE